MRRKHNCPTKVLKEPGGLIKKNCDAVPQGAKPTRQCGIELNEWRRQEAAEREKREKLHRRKEATGISVENLP